MSQSEHASPTSQEPNVLAAIDLGSNSFHLIVARLQGTQFQTEDALSEKVQLAAGLDENKFLSDEAMERGLACLSRFAQRIKELPEDTIKIVATNALREAKNREAFIEQASKIIPAPIEVIAGREEARLIYMGVSHTTPSEQGRRLVVDIGGGSTEFIIGERFDASLLESLHMGCVRYNKRFFPTGQLSRSAFEAAKTAAMQELLSIRSRYRRKGWDTAVGSSGTVKAVLNACRDCGSEEAFITAAALDKLIKKVLSANHVDDLNFPSVKPERIGILPAGLAILSAVFDSLSIEQMHYSDGALREGLLYDMVGRMSDDDIRQQTIDSIARRYHIDQHQAKRVEQTAVLSWAQVKDAWNLADESYHNLLCWAASTHEIGLTIAHSQFHKHSAYMLRNSDMPGFTGLDQLMLSALVRGHRRKFPKDEEYVGLPKKLKEAAKSLTILIRLSVLMHRSRSSARLPLMLLTASEQKLSITFPKGWLKNHPLTLADLELEATYLKSINYELNFD